MEMTPEVKKALKFIAAQAASGVCATSREVQAALNKKSRSHTQLVLRRMKAAGLIEWEPGRQRTLRPAKRSHHMLRVAKMYYVGGKVKWPFSQWRAVDSLWLDPRLLKLVEDDTHLVLEAGADWKPKGLKLSEGDRVVVVRAEEASTDDVGRPAVLQYRGELVVSPLFFEGGWLIREPQLRVNNGNYVGMVVAVISSPAKILSTPKR